MTTDKLTEAIRGLSLDDLQDGHRGTAPFFYTGLLTVV